MGDGQKIWSIQTTITQISVIIKNHLIQERSSWVVAQKIQAESVRQAVAKNALYIITSHQTHIPKATSGVIASQRIYAITRKSIILRGLI